MGQEKNCREKLFHFQEKFAFSVNVMNDVIVGDASSLMDSDATKSVNLFPVNYYLIIRCHNPYINTSDHNNS